MLKELDIKNEFIKKLSQVQIAENKSDFSYIKEFLEIPPKLRGKMLGWFNAMRGELANG